MDLSRACGVETELTVAEGEGLSVGAYVVYRSNVDLVRLRTAHVAWMMLVISCRGIVLGHAPNGAWGNLKS